MISAQSTFTGRWLIATRRLGDVFAWNRAGQSLAGATTMLAAIYELTPLKDVCLGNCRSPLRVLSARGATAGSAHCGWERETAPGVSVAAALMASLFAWAWA